MSHAHAHNDCNDCAVRVVINDEAQFAVSVDSDYEADRQDRVIDVAESGVTITLAEDARLGDSVAVIAPSSGDVKVVSEDDKVEGSGIVGANTTVVYYFSPGDDCECKGGRWVPQFGSKLLG